MSLLCHSGVGKVSEGKRKNSSRLSSLCVKHEPGGFPRKEDLKKQKKLYATNTFIPMV